MAFDITKLDPTGSGSKGAGTIGAYKTTADNKATVLTDGYFDSVADALGMTTFMAIDASDGAFFVRVVATTGPKDVALTEVGSFAGTGLSVAADLGVVGAAPASGTATMTVDRIGAGLFRVKFALAAARLTVTDAGASGSFGTHKLLDLVPGAWSVLGCRQDYTAFVEGAALTGAAGDAVFDIGVGFTAISAAANGALGAGMDDIGNEIAITLSGGTGTGTLVDNQATGANGTGTASDVNLNWSGTAATIDATSTIDVTGTLTMILAALDDD